MKNYKRIGEGHRRLPGDVVAGRHPEAGEVIGRIIGVLLNGRIAIEADDGHRYLFTAHEAVRLITIQECKAPTRRTATGLDINLEIS